MSKSRAKRNSMIDSDESEQEWTPNKRSRSGRTIKTPPSREMTPASQVASTTSSRGRGRATRTVPAASAQNNFGKRKTPNLMMDTVESKYTVKVDTDSFNGVTRETNSFDEYEPGIIIHGTSTASLLSVPLTLLEMSKTKAQQKPVPAKRAVPVPPARPPATQGTVKLPKVTIKAVKSVPVPKPRAPPRKAKIEMEFSSSASDASFDDAILIDSD